MIQAVDEVRVREHLRELQEEAKLEARMEALLREAYALANSYVDPMDAYADDNGGAPWLPVGGGTGGRNRPAMDRAGFRDQVELDQAREQSRLLCDRNEFAICALENRISYVVGTGHKYTAVAKKGQAVDEKTLQQVQEVLDEFVRVNKWCERQAEACRRLDRDGEVFVRFFITNGMVRVRFVEPWQIKNPASVAEDESTEFGIACDPDDQETPLRYYVNEQAVDADDIQHRKANVDLNVRRGVPLFYAVGKNLIRAEKMLRNIAARIEIITAIALIRKHKGATPAQVGTFKSAKAEYSYTDSRTQQQRNLERYAAGSILDGTGNTEYEFPPAGVGIDQFVLGLQAVLRSIAARLCMPEFMLTSDASNGNYASTMVAEGPAVKNFERLQNAQAEWDLAILDRVLKAAADAGRVSPDVLALVEVQVGKPSLLVRDEKAETERRKVLYDSRIISPQTWSAQEDLDYDQEQQNNDAHEKAGRQLGGAQPMLDPSDPDMAAKLGAEKGQLDTMTPEEIRLRVDSLLNRELIESKSAQGRWVTIRGARVYIDGAGRVAKGPDGMIGKKPAELDGDTKSTSHHRDGDMTYETNKTDADTGLPLNSDGTVTVYHHTSKEKSRLIASTKTLKSAGEPDVYVTTSKTADTGYGDTVVAIRVKPDLLQLDDEFPDGRKDYRINTGKPGGEITVAVGEANKNRD